MADQISCCWEAGDATPGGAQIVGAARPRLWQELIEAPGFMDAILGQDANVGASRGRIPRVSSRAAWVTLVWAVAAMLIVAQGLWLASLVRSNLYAGATGGELLVPSERWRFWGVFAPLLSATVAVALQVRWFRGSWRSLSAFSLMLLIPAHYLGLALFEAGPARPIDAAQLRSGQLYVLVVEPLPTDIVYTLYERAGPLGLYWRRVSDLDYSEDGRFVGEERLIVSSDERWLLVSRAGLWTDCFRLAGERVQACGVGPNPSWRRADYEADMRLRSERIAALAGMQPGPIGGR